MYSTFLIWGIVIDLGNKIIAFVIVMRNYLEGLNDTHLNSFLADWPSVKCKRRSVIPHSLPILSQMPAAVKAADKSTGLIVRMLASLANHIAWGQTYSAQDFGVGFLEKYGLTEFVGLRGPIASNRANGDRAAACALSLAQW